MTVTRAIATCGFLMFVWLVTSTGVSQQKANDPDGGAAKQESETKDAAELSTFMRKKLGASNQILEGLVTDDLQLVTKGGEDLLKMSHAESWRASTDMMYMQHSREFRNSVDVMLSKAKKKSIDGVALAWLDVTLNCIQCHEWVRDIMLADGHELKNGLDSSPRVSLSELLNESGVR